jgi:outer membrane lipoprotein carrier protein
MKKILIFLFFSLLFALEPPKTFKADFVQTVTSQNGVLKYKGVVCMKNDEIFWKYEYPQVKYIWVKKEIYVYEPDLMQVTIAKRGSLTLENILKHSKKIKKDLYLTVLNKTKVYFVYDKTLKKLYYTDKLGNKIEILFFNQSTCKNDEVFKLNFPKDVDIIREND